MGTLETIIVVIVSIMNAVVLGGIVYSVIMIVDFYKEKKKAVQKIESPIIKLDQYTTDCYLNMLQKMITIYTIYHIESLIGSSFNMNASVNENIENEELFKINEEVQIEIYKDMNTNMMTYLFTAFGEQFIRKYIRTYTLSLIINYSELSITDIIKSKDNR